MAAVVGFDDLRRPAGYALPDAGRRRLLLRAAGRQWPAPRARGRGGARVRPRSYPPHRSSGRRPADFPGYEVWPGVALGILFVIMSLTSLHPTALVVIAGNTVAPSAPA
ncbi:hypothetical protein ACRAWF_36365 [Streptomyces sp. L7]